MKRITIGRNMRNVISNFLLSFLILCINPVHCFCGQSSPYDVTVVSSIDFNGSVRRHAIGLIETLHNDLKMNFIASRQVCLDDLDPAVKAVVLSEDRRPGRVALLEDPLEYAKFVPAKSDIKIAFSVCESTQIPDAWVITLNKTFDAVVVADEFFVKVYQESGVKIPIFHLPLGVYIDEFLKKPIKTKANKPFVFRGGARYFYRKNFELLIKAFVEEFGSSGDIELRINGGGKWSSVPLFIQLKQLVFDLKAPNIFLSNDPFSWTDYVEMMSTTDCFVNISLGEGFSITPRESLALGIPTIISDNTAQKSVCSSGHVRAVPSDKKIAARDIDIWNSRGDMFDCNIEDVKAAMRDVYEHYQDYLSKAKAGREWVKQFRWEALKAKYLNLIKPKTIIFGDRNEITDDYFMTDSEILYLKYLQVQQRDSCNLRLSRYSE